MAYDPTDPQYQDPSLGPSYRRPAVITWNRLEPRPRAFDFTRSLRAEVRDALWFLARQLQLGEFLGEDAGSAVLARVAARSTEPTRWSAQGGAAQPLTPDMPIEAHAEAKPFVLDGPQRAELGEYWLSIVTELGVSQAAIDLFRAVFRFDKIKEPSGGDSAFYSDPVAWQFAAAAYQSGIDGGAVLQAIADDTLLQIDHDGQQLVEPDYGIVKLAQKDMRDLALRIYGIALTAPSAWEPKNLRYRFRTSAPSHSGPPSVLDADDYRGGHMDWYTFDLGATDANHAATDPRATEVLRTETRTFLATDIRFPGMPAARWWQFEEGETHFGGIRIDRTDLSRMFMSEFLLTYANDWMFLPYEFRYGSLCEMRGLAVVNTFGERVLIRNAIDVNAPSPRRWSMFTLTNKQGGVPVPRLFLPPTTVKIHDRIVEQVELVRDEASNFAWAVETLIPDRQGGSRDGHEAARAEAEYLREYVPPAPPTEHAPNARIQYLAGTELAPNWFPMLPVRKVGAVRAVELKRGRMPVLVGAQPWGTYAPKTELVAELTNLEESEVPRGGTEVTASFQRARGPDGSTHLWKGITRRAGHGARTAGLRFDLIRRRAPGTNEP